MKKEVLSGIFFLFFLAKGFAQQSPVYIKDGFAIGGYDPVAYFTSKKPVKGNSSFYYEWNGAKWLFSSGSIKKPAVIEREIKSSIFILRNWSIPVRFLSDAKFYQNGYHRHRKFYSCQYQRKQTFYHT